MTRSIETCTVIRADEMDPETAVVRYQKRSDGWYVQTPTDAEFQLFATSEASEQTVIQLVNKKWDARYGDPDPFEGWANPDEEWEGEQATFDAVDND